MRALLESVHAVTLAKLGTEADTAQSAEERAALEGWASALSFAALHRLWQLLLKGHDEVARAALPIEACEMALLRVIHAASLPDPGELARRLAGEGPTSGNQPPTPSASPATDGPVSVESTGQAVLPESFDAALAMLDAAREMSLAEKLRLTGRVVRYAPPEIVLSSAKPFPADIPRELEKVLRRLTNQSWRVTTEDVPGAPSLREAQAMARESELDAVRDAPVVKAVLEAFPASEIVEWNLQQRSVT